MHVQSYEKLGIFDLNIAHSNGMGQNLAAVRTYASSRFHTPDVEARFTRLTVYRNRLKGFMLHKNHNYVVTDSLFADNNYGVDVDRTDGVVVRNTRIIGESESYRDLMSRQQNVEAVCGINRVLIGLDMHTWTLHSERGGAVLENIEISGKYELDPRNGRNAESSASG